MWIHVMAAVLLWVVMAAYYRAVSERRMDK